MFTPSQGHWTCLTYFNLTQLLFLADHDIVYRDEWAWHDE